MIFSFSVVQNFTIFSNKCYQILKIVVVPDSSAALKVPAVDGLLEYRKDKQQLFLRSNKTWNVLALENKVKLSVIIMIVVDDTIFSG